VVDPDPALPLKPGGFGQNAGASKREPATLIFFGLDQSRVLLPALQKKLGSGAAIYEVVLEQWAHQHS